MINQKIANRREENKRNRLALQSQTIMNQMARIETQRGKMFSEIDADFEKQIFATIDAKRVSDIDTIIQRLDEM